MTLYLYHGTSAVNAEKIMKQGFVPDKKHNWRVKSKPGFVYLSYAYAPFYAMATKKSSDKLALIKVRVEENDLYPDDDFVMLILGKSVYTQGELDKVDLEKFKFLWEQSLRHLGNVAVKAEDAVIVGVEFFDGKYLMVKCDPTITPINYKIMGNYYRELSDFIYNGGDVLEFKNFC